MNRQTIRKAILLISFLLFPVTIYYLSPYLIIMGAFGGVVTGSFIVFAFMPLTALFFGRAFCGWLCPAGGLQDCCTQVTDEKARNGKYNWIKYIIWLPWVSIIIAIFIQAGGIHNVDFLYQTDHGISVTRPESYIIFYFVIALIVTLAFTAGKRGFCHYVCWMAPFMIIGTKIRNILHLPGIRLKSDNSRCTSCGACSRKCPMSLDVDKMVKYGDLNHSECILCGQCIDNCQKKAIHFGTKANGTEGQVHCPKK